MEKPVGLLRATIIVRLLSLILAGCGICGFVPLAPTLKMSRPLEPVGILFLTLELVWLVVCLWFVRAAWLGWCHRSARSVRQLCAALMTVGFFIVIGIVGRIRPPIPPPTPESPRSMLPEFIALAVVTGIYPVLSRRLLSGLGLRDERSWAEQKRSIEESLGLSIFLLWSAGGIAALDPLKKDHDITKNPHEAIALAVSILVAFIIYKVGVRLVMPPKPNEDGTPQAQ